MFRKHMQSEELPGFRKALIQTREDRYKAIMALHERGIEPVVTLFHYTLPQWMAARGGWEDPHIERYLARYAGHVEEPRAEEVAIDRALLFSSVGFLLRGFARTE